MQAVKVDPQLQSAVLGRAYDPGSSPLDEPVVGGRLVRHLEDDLDSAARSDAEGSTGGSTDESSSTTTSAMPDTSKDPKPT